jgi:tetratricopeptide (TPR) repeat protein
MKASPPDPARKPRRRWHVPPALTHGFESLDGVTVLDEVEGELGLLLWETYRDVVVWAGTPVRERGGLFSPGAHAARIAELERAGADPPLDRALRDAALVVADPRRAQEAEVMGACSQAAEWAEKRGFPETAITLATAAALVSPAHAGAALRVGQIARKKGEYARAETWFRRTIALGRRAGDWASYAEGCLELSRLYRLRGSAASVQRFYLRGVRAARRHALHDILKRWLRPPPPHDSFKVEPQALHDLFALAAYNGRSGEAQEVAKLALGACGAGHPRLAALAHDVAHFWVDQGRFAPALDVLRAVLPHVTDASARLAVLADLARAAGGAGDRQAFEEAWEQVWTAEERDPHSMFGHWLQLARGARSLRDWPRAKQAVRAARSARASMGQDNLWKVIAQMLGIDCGKLRVDTSAKAVDRVTEEDAQELAAEFVRSLSTAG